LLVRAGRLRVLRKNQGKTGVRVDFSPASRAAASLSGKVDSDPGFPRFRSALQRRLRDLEADRQREVVGERGGHRAQALAAQGVGDQDVVDRALRLPAREGV